MIMHMYMYIYIYTIYITIYAHILDHSVSTCILSPLETFDAPGTWPVEYCASNALGT